MTNLSGHEIRSPLLGRRKAAFFKAMFDALCFHFMPIFLHFHGHLNSKLIVCQGPNKVPLKLLVGSGHD